ncbi:MAG: TetR/AcrR family transcriptional regulator [Anaerolineales bacterium]|nr:TetR/AcrR family transcriptional regulator [Anaerolineales bacterium]
MPTSASAVPDKRAAILETTLELIAARGFHDTPMSAIAKESKVSTGIIYHYFASKDELILELYKEIKYKMIRDVLADYSEQAPYKERLRRLYHQLIRYYINHPKEANFLEQFEHSPYNDPNFQEVFRDELTPFIISFFVQGMQEGVLKDMRLEIAVQLSFGVAISLAKQHNRGVLELDEEIIDSAVDASWDALKK